MQVGVEWGGVVGWTPVAGLVIRPEAAARYCGACGRSKRHASFDHIESQSTGMPWFIVHDWPVSAVSRGALIVIGSSGRESEVGCCRWKACRARHWSRWAGVNPGSFIVCCMMSLNTFFIPHGLTCFFFFFFPPAVCARAVVVVVVVVELAPVMREVIMVG